MQGEMQWEVVAASRPRVLVVAAAPAAAAALVSVTKMLCKLVWIV